MGVKRFHVCWFMCIGIPDYFQKGTIFSNMDIFSSLRIYFTARYMHKAGLYNFTCCIGAYVLDLTRMVIFPSRVSGRGYKIGPVCLCVCVSVRLGVPRAHYIFATYKENDCKKDLLFGIVTRRARRGRARQRSGVFMSNGLGSNT